MTQAFRPTSSFDAAARDFDDLLHPGNRYDHPADVLADRSLTTPQRRAILSAWASDACAVLSHPVLRLPEFATKPVTFDKIMDALRELDRVASPEIMKRKLLHGAELSAVTGHG